MDSEFKVLSELFEEFLTIFGVFHNFSEEFNTFFDEVLLDDFQDFVVLEELS